MFSIRWLGCVLVVVSVVAACGSDSGTSPAESTSRGTELTTSTPSTSGSPLPLVDEPDPTTTSRIDGTSPTTTTIGPDATSGLVSKSTTGEATAVSASPMATADAVVGWSNVVPATVVESLDISAPSGDRLRGWLLRFDDRLTLDVAQGMALEAQRYGIVDADGALDLFVEGAWVRGACDECADPADFGGAASLMEFMLVGGLFGDYDPDPEGPDGARLIVRTFSGVLGDEPPDQIDYLVGSSRLGPMSLWEQRIVDELPSVESGEYLAAIAFEHPCGVAPAGDCR